jgi:uncharacterized protein YjbJ (UPF0337 family)
METVKGRIKEAVGAISDDEALRREGKRDQLVGEVKQKAEAAAHKVKAAAKRVDAKVKEKTRKAVEKAKNA